ncbi:MAG: hypothetical protein IKD03_06530, partial [Clostridia bacterium]|nr:hypothetical protein [Clostridia bacterium]
MKKLLRVFFALFMLLSLSVVFTACGNNECTEHKEKWIIDTPATCTEPGVKHAECENCGFFIKTEIIDA